MNLFSDLIYQFDNSLFVISFFQILFNTFFIVLWKSKILERFHDVYQAEQKIHDGFVPRFGGLVMLTSLIMMTMFNIIQGPFLKSFNVLLWCLIPLIFVTILEDIYNNILPKARLFFIFFSATLVFIFFEFSLPLIDFPIFSELFTNYPLILILLLIISLAALVNAFNLIDGANGLLLFTFLSILLCLKLMSIEIDSQTWVNFLNLLIFICLVQIFFNFPKAFIFCGDLGAYTFGFLMGLIVIIFFGQNTKFISWQAVLILFYPACELIFTIIRRYFNKKNPLQADNLHLHHFVFKFFIRFFKTNFIGNSLTTLILSPIWGFALFWLCIHGPELDLRLTIIGIILNIFIYLFFYIVFTKVVIKKDFS